jgi:hypothetical protein
MDDVTRREFEEILDRKLRPIRHALGLLQQEEQNMAVTGAELTTKIEGLATEVTEDNEDVVQLGTAVASAETKFGELKELVEKQAQGVLTPEEAEKLNTLLGEVGTHLGEATTSAHAQVTALEADTTAA